ncbi:putative LRAT-like domain-containing protein [Rosa chinensis]|uniref:Putative LRAT-like domain-containing protein n=1 Tax=Rosa chinensis TaxID=74649 RepID=A0A2P6SPN0_ROSCH|nr:putative LRAT-like domain-containing protein [Rosa chinensis]
MVYIINEIDRESLRPGDHIYAYRKLHSYSHHGIFIEGDRVIHYNITQEGNTSKRTKHCKNCGIDKNHLRGVVKSCVDCLLKRHTLRRFQYALGYGRYLTNWPGTCTTGRADPPEVTISRANDLFNNKVEFGDYNLFENNCEAFAVFCKTGKRVSDQASVAMSWMKAGVKMARDRLLRDVWVHHGEEQYNRLKQMIDSWLAQTSSLAQMIANLQGDHQVTGA